jgi:tetratricopeptide (TPR) repeat protein
VNLPPLDLGPGKVLGRYMLVTRLGAGGMGEVYSAYDPKLDRKVAIKVLRAAAWLELAEGHLRLLREGQAMARLSHPNVVTVYDIGATEGHPFVAMELVEGTNLHHWLREKRRPWRETLTAWLSAARGLAAAHAASLVHRDFKPENVLVSREGRICVTDFGLARAASDGLASTGPIRLARVERQPAGDSERMLSAALTEAGTILGTLDYMAPEQLMGKPADARSDQFAFCVSLYEALYHRQPFERDPAAPIPELANVQVEPPPKDTEVPARIFKALLKGMAQRPGDRFESMDALVAELARDPIARARRWGALAAAVTGVVVAAGVYQVTERNKVAMCRDAESKFKGIWDTERKAQIRGAFLATGKATAGSAWANIERYLDGYVAKWTRTYTEVCEATWVRGELSEERLRLSMGCLDQRLKEVIGVADELLKPGGGGQDRSESHAQLTPVKSCADPTLLAKEHTSADVSVDSEAINKALGQARAYQFSGKYEEGLALARAAVEGSVRIKDRSLEARALFAQGMLEIDLGKDDVAHQLLQKAFLAAEAGGNDETKARAAIHLVSIAGIDLGIFEEGIRWSKEAEAVIERLGGDRELQAELATQIGMVLQEHGRAPEALPQFEKSLEIWRTAPEADDFVALSLVSLAEVNNELGRYEEAIERGLEALKIGRRVYGEEHYRIAALMRTLGESHWLAGKTKEGQDYFRRSLALLEKTVGPDHPDVAVALQNIAESERRLGRLDQAADYYHRVHAAYEKAFGADSSRVANALTGLGEIYLEREQLEKASQFLDRALRILANHPNEWQTIADARFALARTLVGRKKDDERARQLASQAIEGYRQLGADGAVSAKAVTEWLAKTR